MKTMFADFNALTEAGRVRLTTRGSEADIARTGARPGDWVWLSDGELIVGAQIATDERYALVGDPDWETLVHLDDDDSADHCKVQAELEKLLADPRRSVEREGRIFELLTIFEILAPAEAKADIPAEYFSSLRAQTLAMMGKPELALVEVADARRGGHAGTADDRLFLEILRRIDLPRAVREASAFAARNDLPAAVLATCIDVLTDHAEHLPDDQFGPVGDQILKLAERYDHASDRDESDAQTTALFNFNRGMTLLRLGRSDEARAALMQARLIMNSTREATEPNGYDARAKNFADRIRATSPAA